MISNEILKAMDELAVASSSLDYVDDRMGKNTQNEDVVKELYHAIDSLNEAYAIINDNLKVLQKVENNLGKIFNMGVVSCE